MYEKNELEQWLIEVSKFVSAPISIYLIGGCALSFKGYKLATKDIDIVTLSHHDFNILNTAIKSAGYDLATDLDNEFYLTAL